jgi:hypothetical protein
MIGGLWRLNRIHMYCRINRWVWRVQTFIRDHTWLAVPGNKSLLISTWMSFVGWSWRMEVCYRHARWQLSSARSDVVSWRKQFRIRTRSCQIWSCQKSVRGNVSIEKYSTELLTLIIKKWKDSYIGSLSHWSMYLMLVIICTDWLTVIPEVLIFWERNYTIKI